MRIGTYILQGFALANTCFCGYMAYMSFIGAAYYSGAGNTALAAFSFALFLKQFSVRRKWMVLSMQRFLNGETTGNGTSN